MRWLLDREHDRYRHSDGKNGNAPDRLVQHSPQSSSLKQGPRTGICDFMGNPNDWMVKS
jgi:hypothetical protein